MTDEKTTPDNPDNYDASKIKVLKGLEAVRKRPGMYIGDTDDGTGLHHMVFEVVDNSIDEALAGYCDHVVVTIHNDGSVSVVDNGRGIPVDMHEEGRSTAEVVMTVLHAGGKFDDNSYKVSGGLHGVGVSVVNALSDHLWLTIDRDGHQYQQEYHLGEPLYPLKQLGASTRRGTTVRFRPSTGDLHQRRIPLRHAGQAAARAVVPEFRRQDRADRRARRPRHDVFEYEGGIRSFVEHLAQLKMPLHQTVMNLGSTQDGITRRRRDAVDGFLPGNGFLLHQQHSAEGRRHASDRLPRRADAHARQLHREQQSAASRPRSRLSGDDMREGLIAVLSVKMSDPEVLVADQGQAGFVGSEGRGRVRRSTRGSRNSCRNIPTKRERSPRKWSTPRAPAKPRARRAR